MDFIHCKEYDNDSVIGGSVKYAELLDQGLRNIGHKTIVYSRRAIFAGVIREKSRSNKKSSGGIGRLMLQVVTSWSGKKRKVWIVHHPVMGCLSLLASKEKLIYVCHGPWDEEAKDIGEGKIGYKAANYVRKYIQTLLLMKADSVLFISKYMQRKVLEGQSNIQNIKKKSSLIPPIVEHISDREREMSSIGINRVSGQIYICRRLVERTGVKDFIEKLALSSYCDRFNIIIAGDGPEKVKIELAISESKLHNCKLIGFVSNCEHKNYFLQSEFMVLPSLTNEGFGLVIIEAINNDCLPIVSIYAGGGTDWLRSFYPGLIYNGSIEEMAKCIEYARKHRALILEKLKREIAFLTKEEAARSIYMSSIKSR